MEPLKHHNLLEFYLELFESLLKHVQLIIEVVVAFLELICNMLCIFWLWGLVLGCGFGVFVVLGCRFGVVGFGF